MTAGAYMDNGLTTPSYPTAFGITFTPKVLGVVSAIAGIGLAGYIGVNMVGPQIEETQQLKESIGTKQQELEQKLLTIAQKDKLEAELRQASLKQTEVLGLFSDQKALDTLLLDLNRVITSSNATLSTFTPNYGSSGIVTDGSLGPELNYKLKRQVTDVSFSGTFAQSLNIMQSIDRLKTVLVVQDLKMEVETNKEGLGEPKVNSSFKLYAYVPLTQEEIKAAEQAKAAQEQAAEKK